MECPFCCFLRNYIGEFVRIGIVCNCDTNDHIYRDGYITRKSFLDSTIRLFSSPYKGKPIFTANCDSIFEVYIFPVVANSVETSETDADIEDIDTDDMEIEKNMDEKAIPDIDTMIEERLNLLKMVQGKLSEEEKEYE
ncbi:MAG TPA: hypothetical protein GX396_03825 [Tissierellia bacterium]|nr:hypothetical protein [Tissierellia bacterium]